MVDKILTQLQDKIVKTLQSRMRSKKAKDGRTAQFSKENQRLVLRV